MHVLLVHWEDAPYPQRPSVAAAAAMTVEVVFCASHSTDAAEVAVKLLLAGVIVKKVALEAGISPKLDTAACTVCGHRLPQIAKAAHNFLHLASVELMPQLWILHNTCC